MNKDEEVLLYAPFLYHKFAFSRVKKFYLLWHYSNLLKALELKSRKAGISAFLEVGCGTGSTSIYMAKKGYVKKITGLDLDPIRIQIAKKRAICHKSKRVTFIACDFLDFKPEKKYDLVYSLAAFELIKPLEAAMAKLLSVTNENGIIILDMANPFYLRYSRKYLKKNDIRYITNYLRENGFAVSKVYHSLATSMDPTGLWKKFAIANKTIRIIARRD